MVTLGRGWNYSTDRPVGKYGVQRHWQCLISTVGHGESTGKENRMLSLGVQGKVRQRSMLTVRNREPVIFLLKFTIPSPINEELQV